MKKVVLIIALMLTAINANAQMKLAHVNSQQLLDTMSSYKKAQDSLAQKNVEIRNELIEMQNAYTKKITEYEEQKSTMKAFQLKNEEESIMRLEEAIRIRQGTGQQELQDLNDKLTVPIMNRIREAVAIVSKKEKLDYVFDGPLMIYFNNELDITKKVLIELLRLDAEAMKK